MPVEKLDKKKNIIAPRFGVGKATPRTGSLEIFIDRQLNMGVFDYA